MLNNFSTKVGQTDAKNLNLVASRSITSEALFAGQRELLINHAGVKYRLQMTNQGKLILTK